MPTTRFTATVQGSDQFGISLHMSPSSNDFFLSLITIDNNPAVNGFNGCWTSGSPSHGGTRTVEVDSGDYARLEPECVTGSTVTVTITYHDNAAGQHCIDNIDCAPMLTPTFAALANNGAQHAD